MIITIMTAQNIKQKTEKLNQVIEDLATSRHYKRISTNTPAFLFSTENLAGTYNAIPPRGKDILAVCGSGDHAFDAYLNGAHRVDLFDFNIIQECVMRLKFDLIRHMSYRQFTNYFFYALIHNKIDASRKILAPFEDQLSPLAREFTEKFYTSENQKYFFQPAPFFGIASLKYKPNKIEYIQSEANFNKLKKRLPDEIDFELADAATMAKGLKKNYDIIHMSNVLGTSLTSSQSLQTLNSFCKNVFTPMCNHLNDNGTMIMNYLWDTHQNSTFLLLLLIEQMEQVPDTSLRMEIIESVIKFLEYDSLMLLKKNTQKVF